mmetsp:Transcript_38040/g.88496  ORF Transcript_38040/g.88496 Transcript_38040/m.88496 type:complete len:204 (-) Transcript_38040:429-1040(-)
MFFCFADWTPSSSSSLEESSIDSDSDAMIAICRLFSSSCMALYPFSSTTGDVSSFFFWRPSFVAFSTRVWRAAMVPLITFSLAAAVPLITFSLAAAVPLITFSLATVDPLITFSLATVAALSHFSLAAAVPLITFSLAAAVPLITFSLAAAEPLITFSLATVEPLITLNFATVAAARNFCRASSVFLARTSFVKLFSVAGFGS